MSGSTRDIAERNRKNLIAYLSRVQNLPAPTRDLIFLHSEAGVGASIEPATVDRLADMARNGQTEGLDDLLEGLPIETKEEIVATLARWTEDFALTLERENAVRVLVAVAAAVEAGPQTTALAAGAILASPGPLPAGALADTVRFTQRCRIVQRRQLLAAFRDRDDLFDESRTRAALIAAFKDFADDEDLAGSALSVAITEGDERSISALMALDEESQARVLALADSNVREWIDSGLSESTDGEGAEQSEEGSGKPAEAMIEGLGTMLEAVISSRAAASKFASWLLRIGQPEADSRVAAHFDALAPVSEVTLATLLLTRAVEQSLESRIDWLRVLKAQGLGEEAVEPFDALVRQAWVECSGPDGDENQRSEYLALLAQIRSGIGEEQPLPQSEMAIAESLSAPMQDDESAERRKVLSNLAAQFVAEGLVARTACADALIGACASAVEVLPPGDVAHLPRLRDVVRELLDEWVTEAGPTALRGLEQAATQVPDAALDPTKADALLRSVCELSDKGEEATTTISAAQVGGLGHDYGDAAVGALSTWLGCFNEDSQLWLVVEPMWGTAIAPGLRGELAGAARRVSEEHRRALVEAAVGASIERGASPSENWEAVGLRYVKSGWLISLLSARVPESTEELEQWRRLLEICRQRAPGARSHSALASKLLKPLAQIGSDEAVNLMLEHLGLLGRKNAEELLGELKLSSDQKNRAEERLRDLGFKKSTIRSVIDSIRRPSGGSN